MVCGRCIGTCNNRRQWWGIVHSPTHMESSNRNSLVHTVWMYICVVARIPVPLCSWGKWQPNQPFWLYLLSLFCPNFLVFVFLLHCCALFFMCCHSLYHLYGAITSSEFLVAFKVCNYVQCWNLLFLVERWIESQIFIRSSAFAGFCIHVQKIKSFRKGFFFLLERHSELKLTHTQKKTVSAYLKGERCQFLPWACAFQTEHCKH